MNVISMVLLVVYGLIGGLATLFLFLGMPGVFFWKVYRKFKYNIKMTD